MPKPKHHIIICSTTRPEGNPRGSCGEKGSKELLQIFFGEMAQRGLFGQILITESTCMGPCQLGPTVVVYPDGIWYKGVIPSDVPEIFDEHIIAGRPVARLILPDEIWG